MLGTVFDIKEFSIYDGPGVRSTVFLKGCPLRCKWCHNPEGLTAKPQVMVSSGCVNCGVCLTDGCSLSGGINALLNSSDECKGCGKCIHKCPFAFRKLSGTLYTPKELADKIMKNAVFFGDGGGVTFSGGEPTMQSGFLLETLSLLPIHKAIQTCGYCESDTFAKVVKAVDFLFFDIKHTDPKIHEKYTGVSNELIKRNLDCVKESGKPFIARIPLIKGVNDSSENLTNTAAWLKNSKNLLHIELLPYNGAAGAKYKMTGKAFSDVFEAPDIKNIDTSTFEQVGIKCRIM